MHIFLDERDKQIIDEQLNNLETNFNELSKDLVELQNPPIFRSDEKILTDVLNGTNIPNNNGLKVINKNYDGTSKIIEICGKNFFKNPIEEIELYGIKATPQEDGSIKISGTAIADTFMILSIMYVPSGSFTISANNSEINNGCSLRFTSYSSTKRALGFSSVNRSYTWQNDYPITGCILYVTKDTICDFTIKPQVELENQPTTYEAFKGVVVSTNEEETSIEGVNGNIYTDITNCDVKYYESFESAVNNAIVDDSTNKLNGKKIAFFGDSIVYGSGSFGYTIPENNGMIGYNLAVGGMTYAIKSDSKTSNNILLRMRERINYDFDYIIFQGGVNDAFQHLTLGEMLSETDFTSETDESTFGGAFESACRLVVSNPNWIGKKVGFIANAKIPRNPTLGQYMDLAKQICKKYSIPVLDLYNESGLCAGIQGVNDALYNIDSSYSTEHSGGTHPNALGYSVIYDKVEEFVKRL